MKGGAVISHSQQGQYFPLHVNRAQLHGTSTDSAQDLVHLEYEPQASTVSTLVYCRLPLTRAPINRRKQPLSNPKQSKTFTGGTGDI